MLRTGEIVSLCANHLFIESGLNGAVTLLNTKMSQRRGGVETVHIEDQLTAAWACIAKGLVGLNDRHLRTSPTHFRHMLFEALASSN